MFPLRDSIPSARPPVVSVLIIVACVVAFFYELLLGRHLERFLFAYAFVPVRFFYPEAFDASFAFNLFTLVFSMFLHGGWLHLIGNMWFLWVFGDNVEDALGHGRFFLFYLVCGAVAALTQGLVEPGSRVPMIGASGAIAGVLGAYLLWFPWSRIKSLVFLGFFVTMTELPAPVFLILWFIIQFFSGTLSLAAAGGAGGGVAWFAHIGGFLAGATLAWWLRRRGHVRPAPRYFAFWE
ncbi:MAG: rhomboid family intramembrane serine protease [Thermoanaerobaculum sp.]|nr:rhomboid family intramembrane serine protease [Thermoanaerobaculum sp.]MCX7895776.1 rhomboid family intramembrane serine protease [Thermoanaerobaculum sp.]MDW7967999.1 rhomboid family intramembrane serine protease [Thermoanaerobaculum sp.]